MNSVLQVDHAVNYPVELFNSLNHSGFPQHLLTLKIGTLDNLLRNFSPPKLCNRTRLRTIGFQENLTGAKIMIGSEKIESVFILRTLMIPSDYPFQFMIMQFLVEVYFDMTINKS
jgi:hypothetical protein